MSLTILIALFSIGFSSYTIYYANPIYHKLSSLLNIFEGNMKGSESNKKEPFYEIILIGGHRSGSRIIETLKKMKIKFLVVDYNPKIINQLSEKGIRCLYGDANDKEFINELKLAKVKMIISTIPSTESDFRIKDRLEEIGSTAIFIATAEHNIDARKLYKKGIDYVILPQYLGGEYIASTIEKNKFDEKKYKSSGLKLLKKIKKNKKP
jgi:hypothetical protein